MSVSANDKDIVSYIQANSVIIIGTIDPHGALHGAAVYAYAPRADKLYFITKNDTKKFQNILHNPEVSVTIVNSDENSTLQSQGHAEVVSDPGVIGEVMHKMTKIYAHSVDWLPPIAKIHAGPYQVVKVTLRNTRLANFLGAKAGSEHIFKESN
ncbi:MAG TPA: pyridoxamine 5'-phosphate oxidase family protein [Candidatus Saccharimonadales bacterium]|nr:pyridoxamine 5'-phosphate oxidase family protein [Candidatus Saccharimonadales bacterium]